MSFRSAVEKLRLLGSTPATLSNLVRDAGTADDDSIALLARVLAESGRVAPPRSGTCDLASTGGPSSLSTLLCPLYLRALGYIVPKVGVPGRPAGAVDVLATIAGYEIDLTHLEFERMLAKTGFCHAIAGKDVAPIDAELFRLRKQFNAVNVAPLVIASLLSKKVAVGLDHVVLDVRVSPYGNFGRNLVQARNRATRYCRVAELLGIRATCVLTDGSRPYQPFIGRGESLLALDLALYGEPDRWLQRHIDQCGQIVALAARKPASLPNRKQLRQVFEAHLVSQGSSYNSYRKRVAEIASEATTLVHSESDGFIATNMELIRKTIVDNQASQRSGSRFSDPVGAQLLVESGCYVTEGKPVAAIRHNDRNTSLATMAEFRMAFSSLPTPPDPQWNIEAIRSTT